MVGVKKYNLGEIETDNFAQLGTGEQKPLQKDRLELEGTHIPKNENIFVATNTQWTKRNTFVVRIL